MDQIRLDWEEDAAVCIVMASGGYPQGYETGFPIEGVGAAEQLDRVVVFHAGTKKAGETVLTAGGRVLGVTAKGQDLEQAIEKAYEAVGEISFPRQHYRKDIGVK